MNWYLIKSSGHQSMMFYGDPTLPILVSACLRTNPASPWGSGFIDVYQWGSGTWQHINQV